MCGALKVPPSFEDLSESFFPVLQQHQFFPVPIGALEPDNVVGGHIVRGLITSSLAGVAFQLTAVQEIRPVPLMP